MRLLSSKIFKNNQVTYGMPFQVRIPLTLQNLKLQEEQEVEECMEETERPETILEKAHEEAALIIKEATFEARRVMEEAYTEAKEKVAAMEEEALQKGYSEGTEAAQQEYDRLIAEAERIKENARVEHDDVLCSMENEMIELVLDIAKKVIGQEMCVNKDNIISLVKDAIDKCSNKSGIVLKVASEDYEYLKDNMDRLKEVAGCIDDLELKQDLSMKPGSCVLDTLFGSMDAGVQTKLMKIEEAFRELMEGK